jgi:hypothetical protein
MVFEKDGTYTFTGTTKDTELAEAIKRELEEDDDLLESELVRDAVSEYLEVD